VPSALLTCARMAGGMSAAASCNTAPDEHTCALRSRLSAAACSSGHHSRHLLKAQVVHWQRCGGADSRSPQRTPLTARRTAAADAGGKEARQTRGRERRQHGPDRQRGGKGGTAKLAARVWRRQPPVVSQRARCTRRSSPMRQRPCAGRRRRRLPLRAAAATHVVATMP
jgi:hypothetical protein